MSAYRIVTDSGCDLPVQMIQDLNLTVVPLTVLFRGENRPDSVEGESIREIYAGLREGENATTSAVNPDGWASVMEPIVQAGEDVLVLAFSSGLSTTYQSAVIAANELMEQYPERKIFVVDSRCASLGQGLLVWYLCKKRDEGMSLEDLTQWCAEEKFHLCHWFTVDDLMFLKRGGRISSATALLGTMLNIKPVLHMDDEGHLINRGKVRGRKASLESLVNHYVELATGEGPIYICHADCMDDVELLKGMLREKAGVEVDRVCDIGAVIGSHSGPGTIALFFLGKKR